MPKEPSSHYKVVRRFFYSSAILHSFYASITSTVYGILLELITLIASITYAACIAIITPIAPILSLYISISPYLHISIFLYIYGIYCLYSSLASVGLLF